MEYAVNMARKSKNKLTKLELVERLAEEQGVSRDLVRNLLGSFLQCMVDGLEGGRNIEFRGFGTFEIRMRKGRANARNPRTGEKVAVPSHGAVFFRPGKLLRERVWNLEQKSHGE